MTICGCRQCVEFQIFEVEIFTDEEGFWCLQLLLINVILDSIPNGADPLVDLENGIKHYTIVPAPMGIEPIMTYLNILPPNNGLVSSFLLVKNFMWGYRAHLGYLPSFLKG